MSKRRWFQIHLSTAIINALLLAALLGLNLAENSPRIWLKIFCPSSTLADTKPRYGWPFAVYPSFRAQVCDDAFIRTLPSEQVCLIATDECNVGALIGNVMFCLLLVAIAIRISEQRIRRMAKP